MKKQIAMLLVLLWASTPAFGRQATLAENHKIYALIQEAQGQPYEQSLKTFEKAVGMDPKCSQVYESRAKQHLAAGKLDRALADCNKAIEVDSENEYAYLVRAKCNFFLDKYELAIADAKRFADLDRGERAWGRFNYKLILGASYYKQKSYKKALELLPTTGDVGSDCSDGLYYRGLSHYALGEYQKALSDLNTAIKSHGFIPKYYRARADVYKKLGKSELASRDISAAEKLPLRNKAPRYDFL
jgi:tetratricopeptide (TPR) repeat protein